MSNVRLPKSFDELEPRQWFQRPAELTIELRRDGREPKFKWFGAWTLRDLDMVCRLARVAFRRYNAELAKLVEEKRNAGRGNGKAAE